MDDFAVNASRVKSATLSKEEVTKLVESCREDVRKEIIMRATSKRKITLTIKKLNQLLGEGELTEEFLANQVERIKELLKEVEDRNSTIISKYESHNMLEMDPDCFDNELESQNSYQFEVNQELCHIESKLGVSNHKSTKPEGGGCAHGTDVHGCAHSMDVRPPPLHCGSFSGDSKNPFEFQNFLKQFNNVIDSKRSLADSAKLTYLRGYLRGYAFTVIQHLSISDSNYEVAQKLLKDEFLDIPFIIDETLKRLITLSPKYDSTYGETRVYLNEVRSLVHELKGVGLDFMVAGSAGCTLLSHIIFDKLPPAIKRELAHKVDSNYPTLCDIFDEYNEVIKTLNRSSGANRSGAHGNFSKGHQSTKVPTNIGYKTTGKHPVSAGAHEPGTLQSFQTSTTPASKQYVQSRLCKFCNVAGHSMTRCPKYDAHISRVKRCDELKLCSACSSSKHATTSCPGQLSYACMTCQSKSHISALCPKGGASQPLSNTNVCLNSHSNNKPYILPTITIPIGRGKDRTSARLLIDTGSQRSYLSGQAGDKLCLRPGSLTTVDCEVKTFIDSGHKRFSETVLEVYLPGRKVDMPVLIDPNFELETEVSNLGLAVTNIQQEGVILADCAFQSESSDRMKLDGIMGTDLIQFLPQFTAVPCMKGSAFATTEGLVPFGHVEHFLYPDQIPRPYPSDEDEPEDGDPTHVYDTYVCLVMDPRKSYFSIIDACSDDSQIEQGLEHMFSLESIGLPKDGHGVTDTDLQVHEQFSEDIEFSNSRYHVKLPWNDDKIDSVPSNHQIALAVLDRVEKRLSRQGVLDQYIQVFDQQLADNIIEEIQVDSSDLDKHVWIPHRPVFKTEAQATTKVRPVFNCSLKVNELPSLNEAAFPGMDLMADLTQLLLIFRSETYVLLSDVKQAYLQIKLKSETDRNRFCFFLRKDGVVKMFRYTTIVFGFVSSSYILHNVIQRHASQYPDDKCTSVIKNQMYVDNLIMTSSQVDELQWLYHETKRRMAEGGFTLRSWSSNEPDMQKVMNDESSSAEHGLPSEKVLGYEYHKESDRLQLPVRTLNQDAATKRQILSEISKVFDPLGIYLPVTVRGRILLRELWLGKLGWDQEQPEAVKAQWQKLCADLTEVQSVSFPRMAIKSSETNSLFIFTDASKTTYGFTVYCLSGEQCSLVFAKAKIAPLSDKSIPALELLAVYLALKCLSTILAAYSDIQFQSTVISVDAQIVLSWILSGEPKTKSIFVRNRVKDITSMRKRFLDDRSCDIQFRYVASEANPADLLTRGLTAREFSRKSSAWFSGPTWLSHDMSGWPDSPLQCLSGQSKAAVTLTNVTIDQPSNQPLLKLDRFSSFRKVIRITALVFKFINKVRKKDIDPEHEAKMYWIKQMQATSFAKELQYLKVTNMTHSDKIVPPLVNQLDLYVDDQGVLRSRGRILKSTHPHKVLNPIVLGKDHALTRLIIQDAHARVQHLGIQTVVNCIRMQGFWVPRVRQAVKKVLSQCMMCRKFNALAFAYPKMTNMTKHQMRFIRPFAHCGVDYTGHLWVKDEDGKSRKMYILIYTCMQVRAVHLDLLPDMSVKSFMLSFQRFTNIHGIPSHLYSDNAKTYIAAGELLKDTLRSSEFEEYMKANHIKHVLIPVYSAWVGSMWERMIRVVKSCLFKTVGRSRLTYFELLTVLSNIAHAINSRPLTYRCSDEKDLEPITPNSFLTLQGDHDMLHVREQDLGDLWEAQPPTDADLCHTLDVQEATFREFRDLWHEEYLLSLREASRNLHQCHWTNRIKPGDVVLIKVPNRPRPYWQLGYILETITGSDDKIRSVKLKRADGHICHYSICHLYPLEISVTHSGHDTENHGQEAPPDMRHTVPITDDGPTDGVADHSSIQNPSNQHRPSRHVRQAATKCRQLIRSKLPDL